MASVYSMSTFLCFCVSVFGLCSLSGALNAGKSENNGVLSFRNGIISHTAKSRTKRFLSDDIPCIRIQATVDEKIKDMTNASRKFFADEIEFTGDSKFSLQMSWTGDDAEVGVLLHFIISCYCILFSDETGKAFANISSRLNGATQNHDLTLQKHPLDSKVVYIVSNALLDAVSSLHTSLDGGSTFIKVPLPFRLTTAMIFHPTNWDLILASDESMDVFLSQDRGLSWKKIKSSVLSVKWSSYTNSTTIFAVTGSAFSIFADSHSNVLEKSEDLGNNWKKLYDRVYTFGLGGKFLYASAYMSESKSDERKLVVSTDEGETWNHARLPSVTSDRFYSILDSTEGQIFLHVDHPGDTGRGTLYLSDATGIIFSESLNNHLYPNYDDLTDFYRVQSMRGVYIASQLEEDNSIHTMITYDRGAEWQPIPRPEGLPCLDETKKCFLQIHNLYSIKRGIAANPPLSAANAVGIILVHGHIAESLQSTEPDVYISSDGGYTWRFALKGPHHYQIADHGGLLVAIPVNTPSVVKFSTDEGHCWVSYDFTSEPIEFTGLLVEPGNRAMTAAIWGYTSQRVWHTHVINFTTLVEKQCGSDDYEDWVAHSHNGDSGCLLGNKETFRRLKKDSWCYNGKAYEVEKTSTACDCTKDDFDCDYGYIRQNEVCVADPTVQDKQVDICKRGHEERFVPLGYHKIPGDICVNGFKPEEAELIDLQISCDGDDTAEHLKEDTTPSESSVKGKKKRGMVVAVVILLLSSVVVIVVLLTIYGRKYRARQMAFQYISIRSDGDPILPKSNSTSLYEDSSDEEVPAVAVLSHSCTTSRATVPSNSHGGQVVNGTAKLVNGNSVNYLSDDDLIR